VIVMRKFLIGAIIERDGKILLIKDKGEWNLPVSKLDKGVNILEDLKIDMKKLVGLDVEAEAVCGIFENIMDEEELVRIYFKVKLLGGKSKTGKWFTLKEIYDMKSEERGPITDPLDEYRLEKFVPLGFIKKFTG